MSAIDETFLHRLAPFASAFLMAETPAGDRVGFLLAYPPGAPYPSENYRWFSARYDDFVYVDRVAVTAAARGSGVGRALYAALDARLRGQGPRSEGAAAGPPLCCEVNLRPPNPGSLAFHRRLGFRVVGEQDTESGTKRVALMVRM